MLTNLWFDLRYALRLWRRTMTHSLLSALVVALSVGLALFVFVMDYSIAFKPLPFSDAGNWLSVQIAPKATERARPRLDAYTYQELLSRRRAVNHIGAFASREAILSEGEESNTLRAAVISPTLFTAMAVPPQLGRLFNATDGQSGSAPVVILSHEAWQKYFAADASIIGRQVRIDAQPMQVVAVMPKDFYAFQDFEIWFPLSSQPITAPADSTLSLAVFVRLDAGQNADTVMNELQPVVEEVNQRYPETFDAKRQVELFPAYRIYSHANMPVIFVSGFIAIAVLLLGSVNISMIFYARLLERSRELALRSALGSSRGRLLRQCLLESMLIIALGLVVGIGLAMIGIRWGQSIRDFPSQVLASGFPPDYPEMRIVDLLAAILAAAVIWLASTLIPALRIARQDAAQVIASGGTGVSKSPGGSKSAMTLVGVQVIISCMLLVVCASLVVAVGDEAGKPKGVATAGMYVSSEPTALSDKYADVAARTNYWNELSSAIGSRLPGSNTAFATAVPTRPIEEPVVIENREVATNEGTLTLPVTAVSDNYFDVLGITSRTGRLFDSTDSATSLNVAVVDERTAKQYWADQDPLGKRIQVDPAHNGPWLTIVGVVSHVAGQPYSGDTGVIYRSTRQASPASFHVIVKAPAAANNVASSIREAAFTIDRDLPLHNLQKLDDLLAALDIGFASIIPVFSVIVGITVLLAASGLFGLISRSVAQRTQEIGVRRALGSSKARITAIFVRQGAIYLSIALVGGCLGVVMTNLLASVIPNALSRIASVIVGVLVIMFVVIFSASYLPTRKAVKLEPGEALRYE
ncbi:MAG: ABC transporter permease [Dokdonella sp.]